MQHFCVPTSYVNKHFYLKAFVDFVDSWKLEEDCFKHVLRVRIVIFLSFVIAFSCIKKKDRAFITRVLWL